MTLGLGSICLAIAVKIAKTRDIGSGVLAARDGKGKAGRLLSSPLGLVLTIERNSIIGWIFGGAVLGAAYGSIFSTIGDIIGSNPTYRKIWCNANSCSESRIDLEFLNMLGLFL